MSTCRSWRAAALGALLGAAAAWPAAAQLPTYGIGRTPSGEEIAAWDLTIPFDGVGLPPGSGTAENGRVVYTERCASCHGNDGEDPKYSRLVGGLGTLATAQPVRTIGSFWPHAPTLWPRVKMPNRDGFVRDPRPDVGPTRRSAPD